MGNITFSTDHLNELCAINIRFWFNIDSNLDLFFKTIWLFHKTFTGAVTITPNMYSLYRSDTKLFIFSFFDMKSQGKLLYYNVFCCFLYQFIGSLLSNITYPVWEPFITWLDALEVSKNYVILKLWRRDLVIWGVNSSFAFQFCSIILMVCHL